MRSIPGPWLTQAPQPEGENERPDLEHEIECRLAFVDSFYRLEELVGECYRPALRLTEAARPRTH